MEQNNQAVAKTTRIQYIRNHKEKPAAEETLPLIFFATALNIRLRFPHLRFPHKIYRYLSMDICFPIYSHVFFICSHLFSSVPAYKIDTFS